MNNREKIARLFELIEKAEVYERAVEKLDFDVQCCAPPDGMELAASDMAELSKVPFEITHSEEYTDLLLSLKADPDGLTELEKKAVELYVRDWEKEKNIPPELDYELEKTSALAYSAWLEAKKKGDYSLFSGPFSKLISLTREAIDTRENRTGTFYDACLDDYEKGNDEKKLDLFFGTLKERVIPLVNDIRENGKPIRKDFLSRPVAKDVQLGFSRKLLEMQCLRKDALVLMTTEHPFTTHFGRDDVRVTTHLYEDNFISNVFSTLHEGGHAYFMQNEPAEFFDCHVSDHMTNAMHECMSRFYENIIGRSRTFTALILPEIKKTCPGVFDDVDEDWFYDAVNIAEPGLIRTEADELTYPLHIIIRYELEKAFMNGDVTVDEIPGIWNSLYKKYLGVSPANDSEGVLQDVHWTHSFGYFPSYAIGSAYGAQILGAMQKDIDVFKGIEENGLAEVGKWLTDRAFSCASVMDPGEWMVKVTGSAFDPAYYLGYLETKFRQIYRI